ncbi:MAG: hypothetical protein CM1200mP39_03780 [Dehalococcoidia bacterium]|nr:MAG: hypothetical protein CM1200mP39_03780 [Dehalococcoidia bacterium]
MPGHVLSHPDHRDVSLQSINDYGHQLLKAIEGLSMEEARWMPTPESNHILWILWHIGRMEDMWGWYLRGGGESAWIEGGWANRLGIDAKRTGAGDSIDQVRNFPDFGNRGSHRILASSQESFNTFYQTDIYSNADYQTP